jgi:sugar lactone lactonase YvrE
MLVRSLCACIAVTAIVGCAKPESASVDSTKKDTTPTAAATASKTGETGDMQTPESVRYDPDLDAFFVANINGNASQHDGNGFIAMVRADSTGVVKHLVDGGKNGAVLDAPKGMAISGDTLWVADIDAVRAFNKRTGAPITSVSLKSQKATFLNDVAIGPDGAVYITDTGIVFDAKGGMTHPGVNRIFKLAGGKVSEVATGDSLSNPNGLTWDRVRNRWLLAPFGGNDVQAMNPGDKAPKKLASGPGQYDGIEALADGRILVSSWADSAVHVIVNDTSMSVLVPNVAAPADIGVDTKRNVIAVPRFNDNKVEYYKIP